MPKKPPLNHIISQLLKNRPMSTLSSPPEEQPSSERATPEPEEHPRPERATPEPEEHLLSERATPQVCISFCQIIL